MGTPKKGISFPEQGMVYQRETTNGYYDPTSIPAAIQQKKNQAKVLRSIKKAKDGINIPRSSTKAKEPVQSAAFKAGYCSHKK
jgi:hypothetical protein